MIESCSNKIRNHATADSAASAIVYTRIADLIKLHIIYVMHFTLILIYLNESIKIKLYN